MSRDDGFAVADVDSSYFDDAKVRALWQLLRPDVDRMARALVLHKATMLSSWRHGERVTVAQAAPLWLPVDEDLVAALRTVKMLDRAGKVTSGSWDRWFGAADARRSVRREAGRIGGQASGKVRSTAAERMPKQPFKQPSTFAEPVRPSVPTVPSDPSGTRDPADAYWNLTGRYPTDKPLGWIDDLTGQYGSEAVTVALYETHQLDGTVSTLLGRVTDRLKRNARQLDLEDRVAETARIAEKRAAVKPLRPADDISDEEAERLARQYRKGDAA